MGDDGPYAECPLCGDDTAVFQHIHPDDDEVYECASCKAPLKRSWLVDDEWTLAGDYADA